MHPRPRRPRSRLLAWLAALGMMAVGLAAPAATASAGRVEGAGGHGHRCKCGKDCGGACCCRPKKAPPPASRPAPAAPAPSTARSTDGPCLGAAPCRGEGLPDAPASVRISKAAALATVAPLDAQPAGDRPGSPPCPRPLNPTATPPDEPPETPGRAA